MKFYSINNLEQINTEILEIFEFHTTSIVMGVGVISEWFGNWSNLLGTRSLKFEKEYERAKDELYDKFENEVLRMYPNANGVLNFRIDYEPIERTNKGVMFMLIAQGTPCIMRR